MSSSSAKNVCVMTRIPQFQLDTIDCFQLNHRNVFRTYTYSYRDLNLLREHSIDIKVIQFLPKNEFNGRFSILLLFICVFC